MDDDKIYEKRICRYCEKCNDCEKTKYKIIEMYGSKRYSCGEYRYKK